MAMVLQSEQKYFLYLLRMALFSSPEKIIPSSGDNINKGNTFVHLTDLLPQILSIIIDQQILVDSFFFASNIYFQNLIMI